MSEQCCYRLRSLLQKSKETNTYTQSYRYIVSYGHQGVLATNMVLFEDGKVDNQILTLCLTFMILYFSTGCAYIRWGLFQVLYWVHQLRKIFREGMINTSF